MAIIDKPSDFFNTKLTTGTGNSQAVTGLGFQPDWIWGKRRDSTGNNSLFDSVRGITKGLESNGQGAEFTSSDYYTAFGNDGFTIAAGSGGAGNGNGQTAVQWCWKAGGSASSNSNGSITSSVSANTDAGFSIVSYTGNGSDNATIGHGLGSSINFVIVKRRNSTSNWLVQGSKVGTGYGQYLELNATSAVTSASDNIKSVSSSLLTLGTNGSCNGSSDTYIAYCFSEVSNYSKMGSYIGNGNNDGTFVYTGFNPAFVIYKRTDGAADWHQYDNKRETFNVVDLTIFPSSNSAESSGDALDFLSNGFKQRNTGAEANGSGSTYIYMAFAENPFVSSEGVPTTAR